MSKSNDLSVLIEGASCVILNLKPPGRRGKSIASISERSQEGGSMNVDRVSLAVISALSN